MDITVEQIIFYFLSIVIVVFSILTVTTKRILRSATYLLFVLFATAGLYFYLNYSFLGAVQLTVYAGGIVVLYVFSILLTSSDEEDKKTRKFSKIFPAAVITLTGLGLTLYILLKNPFFSTHLIGEETHMKVIGHALMGTGKYQYLLPFELISVLLLACLIGGIMIARKR
jgi:NADH-quinone oxidoreductase subunit J